MKKSNLRNLFLAGMTSLFLMISFSCNQKSLTVTYNFDKINNRIWIGEDFWSVPLEDWRIKDGRIEYTGIGQQGKCAVLPYVMGENENSFRISLDLGLIDTGINKGSAGLTLGSVALEEKDIRAAIFFGKGLTIGINTEGFAFIGQNIEKLPADFNYSDIHLDIVGQKQTDGYKIDMKVVGAKGSTVAELTEISDENLAGIVQIVNNFRTAKSKDNGPAFWFDNLTLRGPKFELQAANRFGPVLWTMYTLSRGTLKLTAQLPPVGEKDNQSVELQFRKGDEWVTAGSGLLDKDARNVTFKVEKWSDTERIEYRVIYPFVDVFGKPGSYEYEGLINKDPIDQPLKMGALTCQFGTGFPYSPLVKNLILKKPDILYFSGDQIYETNGGYSIKRSPEDVAILNYLGKWYMFGWAFGDLMRNTPTICTPDDHDVFQGNLWGGGGVAKDQKDFENDDCTGFTQTVKMVNAVNRTQCAHLPDPYDPSPIEQGMSVWYTSLNYGRISFAIVSDRIFKSGPDLVAKWEGRRDWITKPLKDPSIIDKPGLEFLGKRQEVFLNEWIRDWKDVDMKVLLSQTLFANSATHHGQYDFSLTGDMDSGGWPKKARDRAIRILRKGFVFHVGGDQHVPSITQYGIDDHRDAGWCYITPAIAVGYSRWFRPDELEIPVHNRPAHNLPNTGEYKDAFGNKNYVYAIGNPDNFKPVSNRYDLAQVKASGFGFVVFDQVTRNITMEAWRFKADVTNPADGDQFPGWPLTISQFDNYGREAVAWLPQVNIEGKPDPVVEILDQESGELEYMVRIKGKEFTPKVFSNHKYMIRVGYPETNLWKEKTGVYGKPQVGENKEILNFSFTAEKTGNK
jgi:alkaline phosphatase D